MTLRFSNLGFRRGTWALASVGLLYFAACGDEAPRATTNVQNPAVPAATATAQQVTPTAMSNAATDAALPATAPAEYTYDLEGRDPFRPFISRQAPDQTIDNCGPLCSYDVGQFDVSGIIWGISQPAAMLRAPDGKPYIVKVGSPIGRNKGKVVSISKERIAVLEKYVNYRGEVVTNRVDIELPVEGGPRR